MYTEQKIIKNKVALLKLSEISPSASSLDARRAVQLIAEFRFFILCGFVPARKPSSRPRT